MCGIIGIISEHEVAPLILEGLRRLEYRGYDSAGIATLDGGRIVRRRALGKLAVLSDMLVRKPLAGKIGIGHTRWATHGAPSVTNAHPHVAGPVAVVHNGIIENHREIRAELEAAGADFASETDTECIAALAAHHLGQGMDPVAAAMATIDRLEGAYALLFLFEGVDDMLIAARHGSPLVIGHGEGEMFVGSDALALAGFTDRITFLEEGDRAIISREGAEILDHEGRPAERAPRRLSLDLGAIDKGGHRHFMAKEIAEQPHVIADALAHYLRPDGTIALPAEMPDPAALDRLVCVACGTAHYAAHVARYWFEELARMPVDLDVASEFRYRNPPLPPRTAAVFISQSGETADTLSAMRALEGRVTARLAVVNVPESSIAREADCVLPILAGPEIGVASTKAFTAQLLVLLLMAIEAGRRRGHLAADKATELVEALRALPGLMNAALSREGRIESVARALASASDILFLGRGRMYPLALEGALKLKEISYIHAEGYAAGELKHGPIALVDRSLPVVVFAPRDELFEKTMSNVSEVVAREGRIILVTDEAGAAEGCDLVSHCIRMPGIHPVLAPLLYAIPAQLLAYHVAVHKGTDVDQPRNLAKSVTVE